MRWQMAAIAPLLMMVTGCATGYTSRRVEQGVELPKHTLLLAETLVFERLPHSGPTVLLRDESVNFGSAMASGVCERLAAQGVDCKSVSMVGVQRRPYPLLVMDELDATNAVTAEVPVVAPAKWSSDTNQAAALSSIFTTLDSYDGSAMAFAAPRPSEEPRNMKPSKLSFSPADFTTLFGRSITSIVVLAQGSALARRSGSIWKDIGIAVTVGLVTAIASGGNGYVQPGAPMYPWSIKAVAVDTSTGEILWADVWRGQGNYRSGEEHNDQNVAGYDVIRPCPVFKAK